MLSYYLVVFWAQSTTWADQGWFHDTGSSVYIILDNPPSQTGVGLRSETIKLAYAVV